MLSRHIPRRSTTRPLGSSPPTPQLVLPKSIPRILTSIASSSLRLPGQGGGEGRAIPQRGQEGQALGRSRGGFSSKIHLKLDFDGFPLAFHLTGGEASDSRNFEILLDIGPDIAPRAALGDKGCDTKANRHAARRRGICPAIPYRESAAAKPAFFSKILYKGRARAEQGVGKIKRFKRIALRCEKTAQKFAVLISLACTLILVKTVHTA